MDDQLMMMIGSNTQTPPHHGDEIILEELHNNMELKRGPWTVEEDLTLINYVSIHGEGRWNSLARCAGLNRTGKSCRLRWLNYLRPDVRRGNITLQEQLLILQLHSRWGNRWSKIAQYLPGRTDNEIKNYWRTRVQKHAKQLKCDVNSKQFKDTMRYLWIPRLLERIQAAATAKEDVETSAGSTNTHTTDDDNDYHLHHHHHTITAAATCNNTINSSTNGNCFVSHAHSHNSATTTTAEVVLGSHAVIVNAADMRYSNSTPDDDQEHNSQGSTDWDQLNDLMAQSYHEQVQQQQQQHTAVNNYGNLHGGEWDDVGYADSLIFSRTCGYFDQPKPIDVMEPQQEYYWCHLAGDSFTNF
ncbi:hypothetical protein Dimus_000720 [Dionaea muscipula]